MKGLRKYITPFAPDQSGAVAVFFELGGIVIICDAGGCTGNVCGFDEPRWFEQKSAVFSAGLRDMDAILGRDDKLVEKLKSAADKLDANFAAIVGTPVPAVIATDYKALCRMAEKKTNLPVLYTETTGMKLYDAGASMAYLALMEKFAGEKLPTCTGRLGVLGATPLDLGGGNHMVSQDGTADQISVNPAEQMVEILKDKGWKEVWCYGMGAGLEQIRQATSVEKNLVVAPSGLAAARWMKDTYGIPYEIGYPLLEELFQEEIQNDWKDYEGKKVLIVHQQVLAEDLSNRIQSAVDAQVTVASWFMMEDADQYPESAAALEREGTSAEHISLKEEDQWMELVNNGDYQVIIGDLSLKKAIPDYKGTYRSLPHFAISGQKGQITERA